MQGCVDRKQASLRFQKSGADGRVALESQPKVLWEFGDRMSFCPTFPQRERKSFILYMSYTQEMKFQFFRTFDTNFTEDDESIDFLDDEVSRSSASTPKSNYDYVSNILILSDFYNPRSILRNKRRNRARENRRRMKTWL